MTPETYIYPLKRCENDSISAHAPAPQQGPALHFVGIDGVGARADEPRQAVRGRLVVQALPAAGHARHITVGRPVLQRQTILSDH